MAWNFLPRIPQEFDDKKDHYQIDLNRALNGWWREYSTVLKSVSVQTNGDVLLGQSAAAAYPHIPTLTGAPSGTPTTVTGFVPLVIANTATTPALYAYIGGSWVAL
jgi:hypothetical protein